MLHKCDCFSIFGMFNSRACTFGALLLLWLCWSLLLIEAQSSITDPVEVDALRDIRNYLVDVNGNLRNWNRGDPCTANWTGVLCFSTTMNDGYLHVTELQLLSMNLSGGLSPSLGRLSYLRILDFMWNDITGSIPKEIGDIKSLELLLLNGNQLTGSLPEELGYLPLLDRIQIDQNKISGPLPKSFAYLNKTRHFHMNNNSISGQIPPELSRLPSLVHFLLDNNNLSGYLPPEFSQFPNLLILQLDNNNFNGGMIPNSFGNMTKLLKLSLRNCNLRGPMPDLSRIPKLSYLDLSSNYLIGSIPSNKLSDNITTIDLSSNNLTGTIPDYFSSLPQLQKLSLANNSLGGSIPSTIWQSRAFSGTERLTLDFENNKFSNITGSVSLPQNVTVWLQGNPACKNSSLVQFCGNANYVEMKKTNLVARITVCPIQSCPPPYEYSPSSPTPCFCAAPLIVGYRLKSPGFWDFLPYKNMFEEYLSSSLKLDRSQLYLQHFVWEEGPRLRMQLKFFPVYDANSNSSYLFNRTEIRRINSLFTMWNISDSKVFGPYELLYINLLDPYKDEYATRRSSGIRKGVLAGAIVGAIAGAVTLSAIVTLLILRAHSKNYQAIPRKRLASKVTTKIDGVKDFTFSEMALATKNFSSSTEVGHGGYGKVHRGVLTDGKVVAVKRAQMGSLQGEKEFLTEIELLSRLHHRNLVSLIGYCEEEGEQMLVYEFMSNGTLRDHLSAKTKETLSFATRLRVALASARGILYLHTEANPPIFHRDIKASNILLDFNYTAKVADFGLSRLAPAPDIEGSAPAHVSTVVKGTPGYLDPEYFLTHKLTDKSDVYSLGVVFLELLTGMQPISHGKNIVREVNVAYQSGMIFSVIDGKMGSYPSDCVEKFLNLALKCCQDETDMRPSMADVVRELEIIWGMTPRANTGTTEPMEVDTGNQISPPSSATVQRNPYASLDVSGSDLVSGAVPSISIISPR
ncbi:hypothetical protein K2173_016823 [Erythroxylum novogranatense]|uniref:non-specific serine/threonine protein kinase n=1 Tax=Erythroxylum novogranatense TaxID=1862640 RepID=A0AAV8SH83_9ROSI|nr:hypothetical protein K2173_016823 [Erythroxylum novogranatense]